MIKPRRFQIAGKDVLGRVMITPPYEANFLALEEEAVIIYVVKGASVLHTPLNTFRLTAGDCALIDSRKLINRWQKNEDSSPAEAILIKITPEIIRRIYGHQPPKAFTRAKTENGPSVSACKIAANSLIDHFIQSIQHSIDTPGLLTEEFILLKIKELLHLLINNQERKAIHSLLGNLFNPQDTEFAKIVHSHVFQDLSLDELAFLTNMSTSSLKRKFKTVFSASPAQYIKSKKLEKAKHLLETSDMSVSEVAFESGFNDRSTFTKSFTQAFQKSPSAYRESI